MNRPRKSWTKGLLFFFSFFIVELSNFNPYFARSKSDLPLPPVAVWSGYILLVGQL